MGRLDCLQGLAAFERAIAKAQSLTDFVPTAGHNYATHERAMGCWFEVQKKTGWTWKAVVQGALMIYGWMPTILEGQRKSDFLNEESAGKFADELNRVVADPISFQPSMWNYINGSFVGTSKFLHFNFPTSFAIWDMNVARALISSDGEAREPRRDEIEKFSVVAQYQELIRQHQSFRDHDRLRDIECSLFRYGQSRAPKKKT